jgi:hypothetical protein
LNFLTDAHSQGRFYVDARIFSLKVLLLDLSITNHCGAFEAYALAQNLGDLPFDQVISMLLLVSCILAQSTKI